MTFEEFQATRQIVPVDKAGDLIGGPEWIEDLSPEYTTLSIYAKGYWIANHLDGSYWLWLGNWDDISRDLAAFEFKLYEFAKTCLES